MIFADVFFSWLKKKVIYKTKNQCSIQWNNSYIIMIEKRFINHQSLENLN